ncbi:TPA: type 8 capsular polysaccharide synthesis protein Cap8K [Staphylococcus aureus]|uniref:type 8 capsular polysaccharide synthesis protein Cap8K n=1 Tax=Staphylococcus aureus TaxID=1280 RepID=UPI0002423B55|nr:type 8 capsular polysaccharide synthesis protein Cap8K [Staphylococcus aureus]ALH98245.1 capsular biosynthesis protein [Staphylococcus aureus]EHM60338.1 polysaccharide biosynthesis protein [Staphylococcus aureus subsp. aureus 21202]MBO8774156.1 type 8 capsular polysaccharide synthesis protein Cap8K [Staphylococcus aureus]MCS4798129.1 type 8 capsular polysaccharide synthesis protein Cap8K [Staphylococcus aureus]MCS4889404.1 type 8 capsular polysaccharide synthesis protein Cap8K [Staphylococc
MRLNKFIGDSFLMILSSGIAQVILIITTPIITRLYSPAEFGEFTIFSNIAMILIPIINARYDLLIVNAKNDRSANILSQISFLISLLILLILIPIFAISAWLYPNFILDFIFIIIMLFLVSLTNIFTNYLNKERKYKVLSLINVFRAGSMALLQIIFGLLSLGSLGLIIGFSLSYITGITLGYKTFKKHFNIVRNKEETKALFLENKNQLVYSTPSILLNSLSFSVVVFFIGILYTNTEVGIYGMAIRVLGIPVTIISLGLSKIFMQQANDYYIERGNFRNLLLKFSSTLVIVSIILYVPLYLFSEELVNILLGHSWVDAITVIKIVIPLFVIRLIVSTVSLSVIVLQKQQLELILQALFLIGTTVTFVISKMLNLTFLNFVSINTAVLIVSYMIFFIALYYFAKNKQFKNS